MRRDIRFREPEARVLPNRLSAWCAAAALLIALAVGPKAIAQYPVYAVTDLGDLKQGNGFSTGVAINNLGWVVGTSNPAPDETISMRGFFWVPYKSNATIGRMYTIDSLTGYSDVYPNGINDAGVIVGTAFPSVIIGGDAYGFYFNGRSIVGFPAGYSDFRAVNNAGLIAGAIGPADNDFAASVTDLRNSTSLGSLGGVEDTALGLNDQGWVVGQAEVVPETNNNAAVFHPFLSFGARSGLIDLGTLGGEFGAAYGIKPAFKGDTSAVAVGQSDLDPQVAGVQSHAFVATCNINNPAVTQMLDLGILSGTSGYSAAYGINPSGTIVGSAQHDYSAGGAHAFLANYSPTSGSVPPLVDLHGLINDSTVYLAEARAINTKGQIVCNGSKNSHSHAFLLTPIPGATPKPPTAPIALKADPTYSSRVDLTWNVTSGNAALFVVERKQGDLTSTAPWSEVGKADRVPFMDEDKQLQRNTTYSYRIKARNMFGDSGYSNPVSMTTRLGTTDVTSRVVIKSGAITFDPTYGLYKQTIQMYYHANGTTNQYPLSGPVFFVLSNLRGGLLVNAEGMTSDRTFLHAPSPYLTAYPGELDFDQLVTTTLYFNKTVGTISYALRVLSDEPEDHYSDGGSD